MREVIAQRLAGKGFEVFAEVRLVVATAFVGEVESVEGGALPECFKGLVQAHVSPCSSPLSGSP
jgi:hypothetical protein